MNKKGLTYIEMVCSLIIIVILVCITLFFLKPKLFYAKRNTFITQANNIVKAAVNKYTNDGNDDDNGYPDDIYVHTSNNDKYFGRVCYNLNSLKGKYLKKIDDSFQGSVEICNLSSCKYKTKIWLSNDEYYLNGVEDNVKKRDLTDRVIGINRCGNIYD